MPGKHNAGGCGCCGCTDPPTCTLTGSGGGTTGSDVSLTWTTTGADTVEIRDQDSNIISTDPNGTSVTVTGGACNKYTLSATNACGITICEYTNYCPDPSCFACDVGTMPSTFTVQFTNNGVLSACACDNTTTASRCSQFSGSFTVSGGVVSCEWNGGSFGSSVFCGINRGAWKLHLKLQLGDCNGTDSSNWYAIITIDYPILDPVSCIELPTFQKLLCPSDQTVDCSVDIPGTYTACTPTGKSIMCDIGCVVS